MGYQFRREDTGEIIEVGFLEAMNAKDGFLEIDGVLARRVNVGDIRKKEKRDLTMPQRMPPSDSLGFVEQALPQWKSTGKRTILQGLSLFVIQAARIFPGQVCQ